MLIAQSKNRVTTSKIKNKVKEEMESSTIGGGIALGKATKDILECNIGKYIIIIIMFSRNL